MNRNDGQEKWQSACQEKWQSAPSLGNDEFSREDPEEEDEEMTYTSAKRTSKASSDKWSNASTAGSTVVGDGDEESGASSNDDCWAPSKKCIGTLRALARGEIQLSAEHTK